MRWLFITAIYILSTLNANSQLSQGGRPIQVPVLKSRGIPEKVMPAVNNKELLMLANGERGRDAFLKPLRFAKSFDVSISPSNEGVWISNIEGYDIWLLKIRSEGAFSINIIFDEFHLPGGTRLFLYNPIEGHYLGAFTAANNKEFRKFAVSPVAGDEVTIQYEVPAGLVDRNNFIVRQVNHDFLGILKYDERRPTGKLPGYCNIDINCEIAEDYTDLKDAVCRLIVGSDICTGTLINNTSEDQSPYIITAAHCFDKPQDAMTAVFTFNYESPYCAVLDGDPSNSISGALMRAHNDSLDFALVELSEFPPPEFRPYFAGWDHSGNIPDSTTCISHPEGHIKKIAFDLDEPVIHTIGPSYTKNGFLRVIRWDRGVTERGSSGGPFFNPSQQVIGTLTGGDALCSDPENDYFSRFDMAWNFRPDSSSQLKYWLDPVNANVKSLKGKRFNTGENLCKAFTNLNDKDLHKNVPLLEEGKFAGYWGGTNNTGITTIAERFTIPGNEQLHGVSLGIGKINVSSNRSGSEIIVKVFNGKALPEELIHSETVSISGLSPDAMNFIGFSETVEPADTFFIGIDLTNIQPADTFVLFQSVRLQGNVNSFVFAENAIWYDFKDANTENYSMANVMELIACNVDDFVNDTPLINNPVEALVYPNPSGEIFTFETGQNIDPKNLRVFNLIGQEVKVNFFQVTDRKIRIDLSGNNPGIYFIKFITSKVTIVKKVSYIPW